MDEHRMTRRFFERVAALCTRLPVLEVAKMAKLSWDTVARVDKRAIEMGLGGREPAIENLRWVGIDEVSRTGGRVYFTVVTNLETGEVVHIGDGKGKKGLQSFLERLTKRERKRVRITSSDLGYLSLLQKAFAKAAHILDRFHIVKWVNDAIKDLRRELFGAAPRDKSGKELKVNQWLLLSGRERLEHSEKLFLARLMKVNRPLYRAYLMKEELRAILHHPWKYMGALRRNLGRWCTAAMRSRIEPLKQVARRLRPQFEAIVAAYQHHVKLGVVEEVNGKIVQLRRDAHGYRNVEYFKLKIYQRCSLPSNPWAEIIL
jgi:transposase